MYLVGLFLSLAGISLTKPVLGRRILTLGHTSQRVGKQNPPQKGFGRERVEAVGQLDLAVEGRGIFRGRIPDLDKLNQSKTTVENCDHTQDDVDKLGRLVVARLLEGVVKLSTDDGPDPGQRDPARQVGHPSNLLAVIL